MFRDGAVVKRIYTADEQQQQAESQKAALLSEAESVIQPLERAVRLNMATDEERTRLEAWERYSVLVSRVDTANPEWPQNQSKIKARYRAKHPSTVHQFLSGRSLSGRHQNQH